MNVRQLTLGVLLAGFDGATPAEVPDWLDELIRQGLAGVTLFGRNVVVEHPVEALGALTAQLRRRNPRLLVAIDEEGGDVTRMDRAVGSAFLGARSLGVIDDPEATRQSATLQAVRLAEVGVNVNFAPVADVDSEPDSPIVGSRSFSSDPARVGRHVAAAILGHLTLGVAPTAKHFPGHGATREDSHLVLPRVDADLETLQARELVPFRSAIAADVPLIMTGHLLVPALDPERPATLSRAVVTGLLRERLGFHGVVVSDGLDMHAISRGVGQPEGVVQALLAGVDLICIGGDSTDADVVEQIVERVAGAVRTGRLPLARLEEAHGRVAALARRFMPWTGDHGVLDPARLQAVAKRSLDVVGEFPLARIGAVVELHTQPSMVAGEVAWGMARPLRTRRPEVPVFVVRRDEELPRLPDGAVVVSVRDLHLEPWQADVVALLRDRGVDVVVVDHGGSADPTVLGDHAVVARDSSAIAARAVAEVLLGAGREPGSAT